ncbi:polysaccharide deacetylase family protein [Neolewinella xylanilytica]|uniref:polysaccharide deacetylase family protein n=1 Tax=Neolewinella xylanilytica TaxID=1514080 RepID=UPI000CEB0D4E|nr:polysaccharide deacetylase family protein [Neolewinella xylanilytica]
MYELPEITIRTRIRHPRFRYVLKVVGADLGYRFRFYNERSVLPRTAPEFLITYGEAGDRNLPAHPLLCGRSYDPGDDLANWRPDHLEPPPLCQTSEGPDLLAAIFFCLSRYEEYQPFTPDAHGRFPASASHALRFGFLDRPVVREWTAAIGRRLRSWFPGLPDPRRKPLIFQPSYDIDLLWAFQYRGWRGYASGIRDVLTGEFARGIKRFVAPARRDPYQTLPFLEGIHRDHGLHPTYFWLVSDRTHTHDTNPHPIPEEQRTWMRQLAASATTGLHPSYATSDRPDLIGEEKARIEGILEASVDRSRQHFLRFRLPDTYRQLLRQGIRSDYTMGYGDAIGWRAGTNLPFPWYDLEREKETRLTVYPFAAMDVTLRSYLGLSAGEAEAEVMRLFAVAKPHGGPFMLLWHNSSFAPEYGWGGWKEMYVRLVGHLTGSESAKTG